MTAAQIIHSLLMRGLNGCSILTKLVTLGLVTQESVPMPHGGGHAKLVFTITPAGLRLLGLKKEAASS